MATADLPLPGVTSLAPPGLGWRALAIASLIAACNLGNGMWEPLALWPYGLAILAWFVAERRRGTPAPGNARRDAIVCAALAALSQLPFAFQPMAPMYNTLATVAPWRLATTLGTLGALALCWLAWRDRPDDAPRRDALLPALLMLGFAARLAAILASPRPHIDVWYGHQDAIAQLVHGLNPFATPAHDIYNGGLPYKGLPGYTYPPANLYWFWGAIQLYGDSRYALLVVEAAGVAALWWRVVRRHPARAAVEGLLVLFYLRPSAPFGIEQAWTEPLIFGTAALLLAFQHVGDGWLAILLGALVSLKQYLVPLGNLATLGRRPVRVLVGGALVGLATLAPFLVWNARALIEANTLQSRIPYLDYNLSFNSGLQHWLGWHLPPVPFAAAAMLVGFAYPWWRAHRGRPLGARVWAWNASVFLVTFALTQAFYNEHYFVLGLMLLSVAADGAPGRPTTA